MKFLHTRLRVSDMEASIEFYSRLGFCIGRRSTSPAGNKLAYLEIPDSAHLLELCWSPEYEVNVPEDLIHTCIGVDDIEDYCSQLEAINTPTPISIWPENWRASFAHGGLRMAFVTDPDGYEVEILEN